MEIPQDSNSNGLTEQQLVDLYFKRIQERQKVEEDYYASGDQSLLHEIETARERIREVERMLGFKRPPLP